MFTFKEVGLQLPIISFYKKLLLNFSKQLNVAFTSFPSERMETSLQQEGQKSVTLQLNYLTQY